MDDKINDKSLKIRESMRKASLAVLFVGAFLDLLLVVLDKDINPFLALLMSIALTALLLFRQIPAKYFSRELEEVNAKSFVLWLSKIAIIGALACISSTFRELLQIHIWITSALVIFFILQFAGLMVGYFSKQSN